MDGHSAVFVNTLNDKIAKPLLDHLLVNSDSKNAVKSLSKTMTPNDETTDDEGESLQPKEAPKPKCEQCKSWKKLWYTTFFPTFPAIISQKYQ